MSQSIGQNDVVRSIRKNIVKVTGDNLFGTGFFIQKEYCITCHHVICKMKGIEVEHNGILYDAKWVKEYSDMEKDIAVLNVKNCRAEPLQCSRQALPQLEVVGFGWLLNLIDNMPQGTQFNGKLQYGGDIAEFPPEDVVMSKKNEWNKKPKVSVECYQLNTNIAGPGISGSPVFYTVNWMVVGMFMANPRQATNIGYVIPVELILDKFQQEKKITFPAKTMDSASIIQEGVEYYLKREYEKSIQTLNKIINDPNYVYALNNKGVSLADLSKFNEAIECYDKALEINPKLVESWYNKGNALKGLNKFNEAIECYDKALEINPQKVDALSDKGFALEQLGSYKEGVECYDKALNIDPYYAPAWTNKGNTLNGLERYNEAIECLDKALEINPNLAPAWTNKGNALDGLGRHKDAIESYSRALQIEPDKDTARY